MSYGLHLLYYKKNKGIGVFYSILEKEPVKG